MKIVIIGATGLIGKKLVAKFSQQNHEVIIFTRSVDKGRLIFPTAKHIVNWFEPTEKWLHYLESCDAIINLAGENVMARRWNEKHKERIYSSRIEGTKKIVKAVKLLSKKPEVFINASAIGYYGNINYMVDESSKNGEDFLAKVVKDWECEAEKACSLGIRTVIVRIGIVLSQTEGALSKMLTPFKFFVGGPLGSGNQFLSWIHYDDLMNIFLLAINNKNIEGIYNAVSPNPVTMKEFAQQLGKILNRPSLIKVPTWVLKLMLGEGAESILNGAYVESNKIKNAGFTFQFSELNPALEDLLH